MLAPTDIAVLLASPAGRVREHALRALSKLTSGVATAADRWLRRVQEETELAFDLLKRCPGVEFWPVMACGREYWSSCEFNAGGELFAAYHFKEDGSLLWNAGSTWRTAVLLVSDQPMGAGLRWYSVEPVLLRLASDEELDEWEARFLPTGDA